MKVELMMVLIGYLLMLGLVPFVWATSPPDYSQETEPVILFDLLRLEPARPALTYGTNTIPATQGIVELQCEVILETVRNNLPRGNATIKWVLPNPKMLTEKRAFENTEDAWGSSTAKLVITQFRAEDAGDYSCQIHLDNQKTEYKHTITIPALDGSPILKCNLRCERNLDEDCQILDYAHIFCTSYGFPSPRIVCSTDECGTKESCPPIQALPTNPFIAGFGGNPSSLYVKEDKKVFDELVLKSARHHCVAINKKGTSSATVFVPVSAGIKKEPGLPPIPIPEATVPEKQDTGKLLGRKFPEYYSIGDRVQLICYTNENVGLIDWAFYNASTPSVKEVITNGSHPDFYYSNEAVTGGYVSQIVFNYAKLEHGGIYECSTTNQFDGTKRSRQLVMETYRWADNADMNQNRQIRAVVGTTVTMNCGVVTTKSDPSIRWYKDELYIQTDERIQKSTDQKTLTIAAVGPEDSGVYTCTSSPRFSLGVDELEGKATLTVTDTGSPSTHITSINNAITSLSSVQETLKSLAQSLSTQ